MELLNWVSHNPIITVIIVAMICITITECAEHFSNSGHCDECGKRLSEEKSYY